MAASQTSESLLKILQMKCELFYKFVLFILMEYINVLMLLGFESLTGAMYNNLFENKSTVSIIWVCPNNLFILFILHI